MFIIIGWVIVLGSVLGGYILAGGKLAVLNQPLEVLIIGGAGVGAFVTSNPPALLKKIGKGFGAALKGPKHKKADFVELLALQYVLFKLAKSKGNLALEQHVENPHESELFNQFPKFSANHHAVEFMCDYLRLLTLGTENAMEIEALMDAELDTHHHEDEQVAGAVQTLGDSFPALGIVAAVLGIIKTMGSITEPPEVLGKLIGAALVGTFLGILVAYGFVSPVAATIGATLQANGKYLQCMKAGILAHVQGYAPQISIEFARKALLSEVRPTFAEVEEAIESAPSAT